MEASDVRWMPVVTITSLDGFRGPIGVMYARCLAITTVPHAYWFLTRKSHCRGREVNGKEEEEVQENGCEEGQVMLEEEEEK